ncbi:helix-turn-helix domain-containing protein [Acetobacterium paludosum]|uniref:Helix-turn-helix domain-containing protein n=2 Tax=Acetobacterium paludosum TaxID=52693 RepID=A0A923I0J7_9FIRM|nr:helix-turn-helix domain-containing protein [Acetobacterium paludosum]
MRMTLIEERKKKNLSRREVAENVGLAEITIRKIEESKRNPSIKTARKLSIYYEKTLDELFPDIFLLPNDTKRIKQKNTKAS